MESVSTNDTTRRPVSQMPVMKMVGNKLETARDDLERVSGMEFKAEDDCLRKLAQLVAVIAYDQRQNGGIQMETSKAALADLREVQISYAQAIQTARAAKGIIIAKLADTIQSAIIKGTK